ncbi:hypothetical protein [cf. Phormidesmis sp. LEGE 11477]|uniref:hypothetical protein n=1 Tax=cf. Phormidesmis sp. LEGE 11477 TaxID=1828680 RepID=UPI00187F0168|nr:hypothetical protein [cf. Phormidesmis sp. LEGE 11477]MBE9064429.1 hypothetical protein [cf. Phormidesmis sp. LEGE 11477]
MRKLELPRIFSERIRGLSIPSDGVFFVCDYDEVLEVKIREQIEVEVTEHDTYEFLASLPKSLGLNERGAIHRRGENSISYTFVPTEDYATVSYCVFGQHDELRFRTLSGDWFGASFSECGKYLVLAEPYDIEIYELDRPSV